MADSGKPVKQWTDSEVESYFQQEGLRDVAAWLKEQEVDGEGLLVMHKKNELHTLMQKYGIKLGKWLKLESRLDLLSQKSHGDGPTQSPPGPAGPSDSGWHPSDTAPGNHQVQFPPYPPDETLDDKAAGSKLYILNLTPSRNHAGELAQKRALRRHLNCTERQIEVLAHGRAKIEVPEALVDKICAPGYFDDDSSLKGAMAVRPGTKEAEVQVFLVSAAAQSLVSESALQAKLPSVKAVQKLEGFQVFAVTFPEPESAQPYLVLDRNSVSIQDSAMQVVVGCEAFYVSSVPQGTQDAELKQTFEDMHSHCRVHTVLLDDRTGLALILVQSQHPVIPNDLSLNGTSLMVSRKPSYVLHVSGLSYEVANSDLLGALKNLGVRTGPMHLSKDQGQCEIELSSAEDLAQAAGRSLQVKGVTLNLEARRQRPAPRVNGGVRSQIEARLPAQSRRSHAAATQGTWDAPTWRSTFGRHGPDESHLREVEMSTKEAMTKGYCPAGGSGMVEIPEPPPARPLRPEELAAAERARPVATTKVLVSDSPVDAARRLTAGDVILVVPASSSAEEKDLSLRSNWGAVPPMLARGDGSGQRDVPMYYASAIQIFRGPQGGGYEFQDKVAVDVLQVDVPQVPTSFGNKQFTDLYAQVELIFRAAAVRGKKSLVLPLLALFGSEQAGTFAHIVQIVRQAVLKCGAVFENIVFTAPKDSAALGVLKVLEDTKPHRTCSWEVTESTPPTPESTRCHHGGECTSLGLGSARPCPFSHPKACPSPGCTDKNRAHRILFRHPQACRHQGLCTQLDDETHIANFQHPPNCDQGANCSNGSQEHLKSRVHVIPLCPHGCKCRLRFEPAHRTSFRHVAQPCEHGLLCQQFLDPEHMEKFDHGMLPLCPQWACCPKAADKEHCRQYSHLCPHGSKCRDNSSPEHLHRFLHLQKLECKDGARCRLQDDPDHAESFGHGDGSELFPTALCCCARDGRRRCTGLHLSPARPLPVINFTGLLAQKGINLRESQDFLTKLLLAAKPLALDNVDPELLAFVQSLVPLHRCKPETFKSIAVHGCLLSLERMGKLKEVEEAVLAVKQHKEVVHFLEQCHTGEQELIEACIDCRVQLRYAEDAAKEQGTGPYKQRRKEDCEKALRTANENLRQIRPASLENLWALVDEISEASLQLARTGSGLQYHKDKELGTDQHVFSIMGPHTGTYYGHLVLALSPEVMRHPDFFVTLTAGTAFYSGRAKDYQPYCDVRAYPDSVTPNPNVAIFRQSALNAGIPGWDKLIAAYLQEMSSHWLSRHGKQATTKMEAVNLYWKSVDSHFVLEAHLPGHVPLEYVTQIQVPKGTRLPSATMQHLRDCFGDRLDKVLVEDFDLKPVPPLTQPDQHHRHAEPQEDAVRRTRSLMTARAPPGRRTGLLLPLPCGMVCRPVSEGLLPLHLDKNFTELRFKVQAEDARGRPASLFLILRAKKPAATSKQEQVTIFLSAADEGQEAMSYICHLPPALHKAVLGDDPQSKPQASVMNFAGPLGSFPSSSGTLDFQLIWEPAAARVRVLRCGPSAVLGRDRVELVADGPLFKDVLTSPELQVFISTCSTGVVVRDLVAGGSGLRLSPPSIPKLRVTTLSGQGAAAAAASPQPAASNSTGPGCASSSSGNGHPQAGTSQYLWQVRGNGPDTWDDYSSTDSDLVEAARQRGEVTVRLQSRPDIEVDIRNMRQVNRKSGREREVRRYEEPLQPAGAQLRPPQPPQLSTQVSFLSRLGLGFGSSSQCLPSPPPPPLAPATWQVVDKGKWRDVFPSVQKILSDAKQNGQRSVTYTNGSNQYEADLQEMVQVNIKTNVQRRLRLL